MQQHILSQIEANRNKNKGMTKEEFDFNKDLLKEIATKKHDLLNDIEKTKSDLAAKSMYKSAPAYEVFGL